MGGRRQPQGGGRQPIKVARFRQKLHENEENWTEREGTSKVVLCRSATVSGLIKRGLNNNDLHTTISNDKSGKL